MLKESTLGRYLATMRAVVRSPLVDMYRIGYSKQSITQRGGAYRNTGWVHIVAIADRMTREDALDLEKFLQSEMKKSRRSILYRKYDPTVRDDVYRRSAGGVNDGLEDELIHGVYLAWRENAESQR